MKTHFLKLKNWFILSIIGLLGFNSCQSTKEVSKTESSDSDPKPVPRREAALMYGVPTINYIVKGKVVDTAGKPISGVQIMLLDGYVDATPDAILGNEKFVEDYERKNAVLTDVNGNFTTTKQSQVSNNERILIRDIDGESNGAYQNQLLPLTYQKEDLQGQAQGWNAGTIEKDLTIQLKKK